MRGRKRRIDDWNSEGWKLMCVSIEGEEQIRLIDDQDIEMR